MCGVVRRPRAVAVGATSLLVAACAAPEMELRVNTAQAERAYQRILVLASLADLDLRKEAEQRFATSEDKFASTFIPSHQLFDPERHYDRGEIDNLLAANGIEATLLVALSDTGTTTLHVPSHRVSTCLVVDTTRGRLRCAERFDMTYAAYDFDEPWWAFTITLVDVRSGSPVWNATASADGTSDQSFKQVLQTLAKTTVERLAEDGVLKDDP